MLCPQLNRPHWGAVKINFNVDVNMYEAVYHCEPGKSLNGDKKRYCSENSQTWSGQEPTCIAGTSPYRCLYVSMRCVTIS